VKRRLIENLSGTIGFVGVGANLGQPVEQCREAVERMHASPGLKVLRMSSLYRSEPVGFREQDWFVNAVAEIRTVLTAPELLKALQRIEQAMGRENGQRGGPRVMDLDLLLYSQDVVQEQDLIIPHPQIHRRRFVLVPFQEIAPYVIHPAFGISIQGLLSRLQDDSKVELIP
jgi:2-amino-4-hydroxy-6-hydroxymethyldihydropteridine diphosphokinase